MNSCISREDMVRYDAFGTAPKESKAGAQTQSDSISRAAVMDLFKCDLGESDRMVSYQGAMIDACFRIASLPAADVIEVNRMSNVRLCETCKHSYPECPSRGGDICFGHGKGNDNVIACSYYAADVRPVARGK